MATVIVLTIVVVATAWTHRDMIRIRIAPTSLPAPPKPQNDVPGGARKDVPLTGDAPWALSALPDCAFEDRQARGSFAFARSKLPAGAVALPAGTRLAFGACTILVGRGELWVQRGLDRLRVPPVATLYRTGDGIALLRKSGKTGDLRVYELPMNRKP